MSRWVLILILISSLCPILGWSYTPGTFQLDEKNSRATFKVDHFWGLSTAKGEFHKIRGTLVLAPDFNSSQLTTEIETSSIDTGIKKRDEHLRSADYFDVAQYPLMTFKTEKIEGVKESFRIYGKLTLHGNTHDVVFKAYSDLTEDRKEEYTATTTIDRSQYGIIKGGMGLTNQVDIKLEFKPGP
jgi:polyisoprenoid-binding protein YceI